MTCGKKKVLLVIVVLCIIVFAMFFFSKRQDSTEETPSSATIKETTIPESTYSAEVDKGPVKVGEEVSIEVEETKSNSINIEVDSNMSGFKSNAEKEKSNGLSIVKDPELKIKKEIIADVDWSDYEINDSELREMLAIGARLIEVHMNESGKYGTVEINPSLPNVEELKEFTAPIMYSVSEDGVLTMNTKLQITYKDSSTYKEVLTPVSVYYEGNVVKLKVD